MTTEARLCANLIAAAVVAQFIPLPPAVRALAAAPLVLWLPGYLILRCVLARPMAWLETVAISFALSLSSVAVTGLVLHALGWLAADGWVAALSAICIIALLRLRRAPDVAFVAGPRLSPTMAVAMLAGLLIAFAGLGINRASYINNKEFAYTELWLTPTQAGSLRYTVGVHNKEQGPERYALEIRLNGKVLAHWGDIALDDGERFITSIDLPVKHAVSGQAVSGQAVSGQVVSGQAVSAQAAPGEQRAEALLFKKSAQAQVYRKVWASFMPPASSVKTSLARREVSLTHNLLDLSRGKGAP